MFQLTQRSYDGHAKHERNDPLCDPWDSHEDKKNAVSISIAFCLGFLIRNENITSEKCKTKKLFEIILHVGRVSSLQLKTRVAVKPL